MFALWSNLAPLILASAVLPAQSIVTLLLVRSSVRSGYAWMAGITAVRLVQGVLFGFVLDDVEKKNDAPQYFLGALLLVLALALYVKALRAGLGAEDEDAPPPRWLTKAGEMSPRAAFLMGAGFMTVSVKFLVFTLGAIAASADAHMGLKLAVLTFVLFVILAQCVPFGILALASSSPEGSAAILDGLGGWLRSNKRLITIIFGVIFGTWFLLKAVAQLGLR